MAALGCSTKKRRRNIDIPAGRRFFVKSLDIERALLLLHCYNYCAQTLSVRLTTELKRS